MKFLAGWVLLLAMAGAAAQQAPAAAPSTMAPALRGMAWVAVNGRASDLSVGVDGAVFAVDPEGQVWLRRPGRPAGWIRLPGDFRRIAAASVRRAWAIDADGQPYAYNGTWWRPLDGALTFKAADIAANGAGSVYVVGADGVLRELDERRGVRVVADAPGRLHRVALDDAGHPWVIDQDGAVHRHDGKAWYGLGPLRAADLSVAHGGAWIVGADGQLLTLDAGATVPQQVAAGARVVATAPGGLPWVATSDGHIYAQQAGTDGRAGAARPQAVQVFTELLDWRRVNGSARQLAISPGGAVLALGRDGEAWQWKGGGQWGRLPGSFSWLALDQANVPWGIASDGRILRYQGSYWVELPGRASEIAGGADGAVWIVQPDGQPARWVARERRWQVQPSTDRLRQLAVAPDGEPWAIAESGRVVRRAGTNWEPLPEVDAASLAIGPEGSVFVVGADHRLRRWDAVGRRWENLNGVAATVAVGPRGRPWVTTPESLIWASAFFDDRPDSQVNTTSVAAANAAASAGGGGAAAVVGQPGAGSGAPRGRANEPLEYRKVDGKARDIGIGADGSVFIVAYDGSLARWSNTRNAFVAFSGQFARVAVAPNGNPWGVTLGGEVFRHDGTAWMPVRHIAAQDIGIGFDGTVIVADPQAFLHRYDPARDAFTRLPVGANGVPPMGRQIAVTPAGAAWTITDDGFVARCDKASCERLPARARSLDIGPEGSVVIVDADRTLRRWNEREASFDRIEGIPDPIDLAAVGPRGKPWLLSAAAEVWASEFFPRDERRDAATAATTEGRLGAGAASPPAFSFTVNMPFEKLANLAPPFALTTEYGTLQLAIHPITGRATLIDALYQFFHYNEATRTLVRDTTVPPPPTFDALQSFMIGKDGAYWVTSSLAWNAEVWRYQSNQWVEVSGNWSSILMHTPITVSEAVDGAVYASGPDGLLYRYDKLSKRFMRMTMPLPNGQISKVAIDLNGRFWVGSNGATPGLYEQIGGRWVLRLSSAPPTPFMEECVLMAFTCFATGANGAVYTVDMSGSFQQLQRWNPSTNAWDRLSGSPNLALKGIYAIGIDGRPWAVQQLGSGSGIGLYRAR